MAMVKHNSQVRHDADRQAYILSFPNKLEADKVVEFFQSISGTLRRPRFVLSGAPSIALELWTEPTGKTWRARIPWQHADSILPQLHSRGISATLDKEYPRYDWTYVKELRLSHTHRTLSIDLKATPLTIQSVPQTVKKDEAVVWQMVFAPALHRPLPKFKETATNEGNPGILLNGTQASRDEVRDRRQKQSEPNFHAVARIAVASNTLIRAQKLTNDVLKTVMTTENGQTRFERRFASQKTLSERVSAGQTSFIWPMELMASELAALVAWPIGGPYIVGMPSYRARVLPANAMIPQKGRVFARSNFHGEKRAIALDYAMSTTHVHVAGPTGRGKSALLANLARQDMENGNGVIIIETKGGDESLFDRVVNYVPKHRIQDTIILDAKDGERPVGFNMLQQGDRMIMADVVSELFDYLNSGRDPSIFARSSLKRGLATIALEPKATLLDLISLYRPKPEEVAWATNLRRQSGVNNEDIRNFWADYEEQAKRAGVGKSNQYIQPLLNRIYPLTESQRIRAIIGQSESGFQMRDVLNNNMILFINLDGIERESRFLLGTLIINTIWQTVQATRPAKPNFLYLDEFQDVLKLPVGINEMLSQSRKYNLGMVLAHQDFSQLSMDVRGAVMNNTSSKIFFQTNSAEDARIMAQTFNPLEIHDFMNFRQWEGAARIATPIGVSQPVTFKSVEPPPGVGTADEVKEYSRQKYGRPIEDVYREIEEHRKLPATQWRKRPRMPGGLFTTDDYQ